MVVEKSINLKLVTIMNNEVQNGYDNEYIFEKKNQLVLKNHKHKQKVKNTSKQEEEKNLILKLRL